MLRYDSKLERLAVLGLSQSWPNTVRSLTTKRNSDGTFRNGNKPRTTTVRTVRARWVEAEGLRLKQMGMSYEAIAAHITAVGRGLKPPVIALLDGVTFPTNYKISKVSVYLAVKAALAAARGRGVPPVANRSL
jgi:hypothetical protein